MTLTPDRWRRIQNLFDESLRREPAERRAYVEAAAAGDAELVREVLGMLREDERADGFLDQPAGGALFGGVEEESASGQRVGRWRLGEQIGVGGMGVVYRAERADGAYDQEAAVKQIGGLLGDDAIRRFETERRALARLSHPNIARLLDGGTTEGGVPYLVMEYVRGRAIDRDCDERGLTVAQRIRLMLKVCRAVHHAHTNLIIHRDLKPGNILIDELGEPKLLDFGIAQLLAEDGEPAPERTLTRARLLTPEYASPEQLRGEPLTTASDVYSLGAVLYRLLAGRRPHRVDRMSLGEVERVVSEVPPTRPSTAVVERTREKSEADVTAFAVACRTTPAALRRALRGDLDRIVLMALRKEPERRYRSALALAEDLERALDGRPVAAREDTLLYRSSKFVQRNALAVGLCALVLLSLVAGVVATARMAAKARAQRDAAFDAEKETAEERDHARIEATSADFLSRFLAETFLSAHQLGAAQRAEATEAAQRLADQVRRQFDGEVHLRANLLDGLGKVLLRLDQPDGAESLLSEAMELRRREFGDESLEVALSLGALGELHYATGEDAAAREAFQRAYDLHRRLPRGVHTDVGTAANNLAVALRRVGRIDEARRLHEEALTLRRATDDGGLPVAESLNNLGVLELGVGDLERADAVLEEAWRIRARILGEDHGLTLQVLANRSNIAFRRGSVGEATAMLEQVAAGYRAQRGQGNRALTVTLNNLAAVHVGAGRVAEAAAAFREVLDLQTSRLPPDDPQLATTWRHLGQMLGHLGRHDEAAQALGETLRILRANLPPEDPARLDALREYVAMLRTAGDDTTAESTLQQSPEPNARDR